MFRFPSLAVGLAVALAPAAFAGDGNSLDLLQISSGALGNALYLDMEGARGARVAGDAAGLLPASQIGSGNRADVTITGSGGQLALMQNNALSGLGLGNSAEAVISGLYGTGSIQQIGDGNVAALNLASPDALNPASGSILQTGMANSGALTVRGAGASGLLVQVGSGNSNALTVEGAGTTASYTQIGNNAVNPQGATVVSNGGSVAITQYSF
ncbi:hypothetical protein [Ruixingdingia sedimenti]|uniref:Curlin associated repeat-containing protein n=1 Tax=Ruixingdingia sedimenti TaxID=3073604 RepID=A0ABU1F9V2_9RHOB|nr:hypothetical protein [Xinfangfangia sp. LG-4]MDR5653207.1 hypothetical protein [Xinfangfangia sp. LG-4]